MAIWNPGRECSLNDSHEQSRWKRFLLYNRYIQTSDAISLHKEDPCGQSAKLLFSDHDNGGNNLFLVGFFSCGASMFVILLKSCTITIKT